jgi:hypothetical protein
MFLHYRANYLSKMEVRMSQRMVSHFLLLIGFLGSYRTSVMPRRLGYSGITSGKHNLTLTQEFLSQGTAYNA